MGFWGEVICYSTTEHPDPVGLVQQVMEVLEIRSIWRGCRYFEPDNSWQSAQLLSAGVVIDEQEFEDIK